MTEIANMTNQSLASNLTKTQRFELQHGNEQMITCQNDCEMWCACVSCVQTSQWRIWMWENMARQWVVGTLLQKRTMSPRGLIPLIAVVQENKWTVHPVLDYHELSKHVDTHTADADVCAQSLRVQHGHSWLVDGLLASVHSKDIVAISNGALQGAMISFNPNGLWIEYGVSNNEINCSACKTTSTWHLRSWSS